MKAATSKSEDKKAHQTHLFQEKQTQLRETIIVEVDGDLERFDIEIFKHPLQPLEKEHYAITI